MILLVQKGPQLSPKMLLSPFTGVSSMWLSPPKTGDSHRDIFWEKKLMTNQSPSWGQWLSWNRLRFSHSQPIMYPGLIVTKIPSVLINGGWRGSTEGTLRKDLLCIMAAVAARKKNSKFRACVQLKQNELNNMGKPPLQTPNKHTCTMIWATKNTECLWNVVGAMKTLGFLPR